MQRPEDLAKRLHYIIPAQFQYNSASAVIWTMTASESRAKGLADAPDLLKAAGVDCQLADARLIGETGASRLKPKEDFYEAACAGSEGFIIAKPWPGDVATATCLEMALPARHGTLSALRCSLPGNADPKLARAKGLAGAPALLKMAGINCQLDDARLIGEIGDSGSKLKEDLYEVACAGSEGFIIAKSSKGEVSVLTCLEMTSPGQGGKPNDLRCTLPGNADPELGLQAYISEVRTNCTPSGARFIGYNATQTAFEVACRGGAGYVLITAAPPRLDGSIEVEPCIAMSAGRGLDCTLTTSKAQVEVVDQLLAKSGKSCGIRSRVYLGSTAKDGASFYEFACASGKGYILEQARNGSVAGVTDCAKADRIIQGGCKLTSTSAAKSFQAAAYSRMVKAVNFDCDVSKYAFLPSAASGKDVVELACANRRDGGIGLFSASGADSVIDCAYAGFFGYRCILSSTSGALSILTGDLKALGENDCTVSGARPMGITAESHGFTEVSCTGHLKSYVIEYKLRPVAPITVLSCAAATRIGSGCRLPGDVE
jgi:hypothetical protein